MKRILSIIILLCLIISLCSCTGKDETVRLKGEIYKTGFNDYCNPHTKSSEKYTDEKYISGSHEYTKIDHEKFDLFQVSDFKGIVGGIYCKETQFEEAKEYYSNSDNYDYYCKIQTTPEQRISDEVKMENVDSEIIEKLIVFAENNCYKHLDEEHNNSIKTRKIPMPDKTCKVMYFTKTSKDNLFTSRIRDFYIIDKELYLVFSYLKKNKLEVVDVPDEISKYVVEYVANNEDIQKFLK